MRIGIGFDVHALVEERSLILGGVNIPHEKGLQGHSDADVLVHSIMDALLGALALGDIGAHFPDTDPEYSGADSLELLKRVGELVKRENYKVGNLDVVVMAEKPKLKKHINSMRINISKVMNLELEQVSVKATTTEKLGFVGREEGIAAQAVVLLVRMET